MEVKKKGGHILRCFDVEEVYTLAQLDAAQRGIGHVSPSHTSMAKLAYPGFVLGFGFFFFLSNF